MSEIKKLLESLDAIDAVAPTEPLKEAGKPEKVARIAAARKLLLIAHAIYKSGVHFRDPSEKEG